mmetsp:Transcript_52668/g.132386  ORF Transcript_52668/g.132386 Transcript_52668/m.132386 type:complete len:733 (-) Transcript_52668:444-2642(-)
MWIVNSPRFRGAEFPAFLVVFTQQVAVIPTFNINLPSGLSRTFDGMSFFFVVSPNFGLSCLGLNDFEQQQGMILCVPLLVILSFILCWALSQIVPYVSPTGQIQLLRYYNTEITLKALKWNTVPASIVNLLYTFLIAIAKIAFVPFDCYQHPNGQWSVREYPYILCYNDGAARWKRFSDLSLAGFFFYTFLAFGVVIRFAWLFPKKRENPAFIAVYENLIDKYSTDKIWWIGVWMSRNLLIALGTAILPNLGLYQIAFSSGVVVTYLVLVQVYHPWKRQTDVYMDRWLNIFFLHILSICALHVDPTEANHKSDAELVLVIVVLLDAAFIVGSILTTIRVPKRKMGHYSHVLPFRITGTDGGTFEEANKPAGDRPGTATDKQQLASSTSRPDVFLNQNSVFNVIMSALSQASGYSTERRDGPKIDQHARKDQTDPLPGAKQRTTPPAALDEDKSHEAPDAGRHEPPQPNPRQDTTVQPDFGLTAAEDDMFSPSELGLSPDDFAPDILAGSLSSACDKALEEENAAEVIQLSRMHTARASIRSRFSLTPAPPVSDLFLSRQPHERLQDHHATSPAADSDVRAEGDVLDAASSPSPIPFHMTLPKRRQSSSSGGDRGGGTVSETPIDKWTPKKAISTFTPQLTAHGDETHRDMQFSEMFSPEMENALDASCAAAFGGDNTINEMLSQSSLFVHAPGGTPRSAITTFGRLRSSNDNKDRLDKSTLHSVQEEEQEHD